MKTCPKCKRRRQDKSFRKLKQSPDGLDYWCKFCRREYKNAHRKKNPDMYYQNDLARIRKRVQWLKDYRLAHGCKWCGAFPKDARQLVFHHVDPSTKEFLVGGYNGVPSNGWDRIDAELKKCIVVCRSCHTRAHNMHRMHGVPLPKEES